MTLLTSFLATDDCKNCQTESEGRAKSHMGSRGATYRVGDDVSADITLADIERVSFVVRPPSEGFPIRVLTTWTCDNCHVEGFAEVDFQHGRVADICPITLTSDRFDHIDYVEAVCDYQIERFINRRIRDERGVWRPWVRVLRERLDHAHRMRRDAESPKFPPGTTIVGGRYLVEEHYLGCGADQLWFARSTADPSVRFMVSSTSNNGLVLASDGPDLCRPADGLFIPRFLGNPDLVNDDPAQTPQRGHYCVYVEQLPEGQPLYATCEDPAPYAIRLGAQIGALLQRASASGVLNVGLRPEYVWVTWANELPTVTGVGGRNGYFFGAARRRRDLPTHPLFTHRYYAPEASRNKPHDDRALVLTLAVMIAEWLIGRYPYNRDGEWGYARLCEGDHIPLPGPKPLTDLLASALRPNPAHRPNLATFTRALSALESVPFTP